MKKSGKGSQNSSVTKLNANILQRFFLFSSGANMNILKSCPEEVNRFTAVGATIFLTGILASLSGGYAFHFTFNNTSISICFGILWGVLIFNLDRYIVLSLKKPNSEKLSFIIKEQDKTKRKGMIYDKINNIISLFLMVLPRFFLATIISFTISKPFELKLFETSINSKMLDSNDEKLNQFKENYDKIIDSLNSEIANIDQIKQNQIQTVLNGNQLYKDKKASLEENEISIENIEQKIRNNQEIIRNNTRFITETYNENGLEKERTKRIYTNLGYAKIRENKDLNVRNKNLYEEKLNIKKDIQEEENSLLGRRNQIVSQYDSLKIPIQERIKFEKENYPINFNQYKSGLEKNKDILAQLLALEKVKESKVPGEQTIAHWVSWLITLLFLALETSPVLIKLLTPRGPYEEMDDGMKYKYFIESQKEISLLNAKVNSTLDQAEKMEQIKAQYNIQIRQKDANGKINLKKTILESILKKQERLAEIQIKNWYNEEIDKLNSKFNTNEPKL